MKENTQVLNKRQEQERKDRIHDRDDWSEKHKCKPYAKTLLSKMENAFQKKEQKYLKLLDKQKKIYYQRLTPAELFQHQKAIKEEDAKRQKILQEMIDKFPNLRLDGEEFKEKCANENLKRVKSDFYLRQEKAKLVTEEAKRKLEKISPGDDEEWTSTVPRTPDYKRKNQKVRIEEKIEENQPLIQHYLHTGAQAKRPPSPKKDSKGVNKSNSKIIQSSDTPKLLKSINYLPEISKLNKWDQSKSLQQLKNSKDFDINYKYKEFMRYSDQYAKNAEMWGLMGQMNITPISKSVIIAPKDKKHALLEKSDSLYWQSVQAKMDLLDEFDVLQGE